MSRKYFINTLQDKHIILQDKEYHHIVNVMRTKEGDILTFTDGKGNNYDAILVKIETSKNLAIFDLLREYQEDKNKFDLLVCVGLMKGDKNEFAIQKCAELGATKILFFESEYCVAKMKDNKLDRYSKISVEASKQSGRATVLEVMPTIKFKDLPTILNKYDKILCAYEKGGEKIENIQNLKNSESIAIIVGSEGGFASKEIDYLKKNTNAEIITLGKNILRAETSVVTLTAIIMHEKGEI